MCESLSPVIKSYRAYPTPQRVKIGEFGQYGRGRNITTTCGGNSIYRTVAANFF